jgi:hypothetical protein
MVTQNPLLFAPGNPGNNRFRNDSLLTLVQQITLMNTGVLQKLRKAPVILSMAFLILLLRIKM